MFLLATHRHTVLNVANWMSIILEVNGIMRGVIVPKGKSHVTFSYLPESFMNGIYLLS